MSLYLFARRGDIDRLRDALLSDVPAVRRRASELLGETADPAEVSAIDDLLHHALEDEDPHVREAAVTSLDAIGPEALDRLVGQRAMEFGVGNGELTTESCARVLEADRPELRLAALHGLERLGSSDGVPVILKALDDPDERVRRRACRACGTIADPHCTPGLVEKLSDTTPVRRAATIALGQIGSDRACRALLSLLDAKDPAIRRDAARALGIARYEDARWEVLALVGDPDATVAEAAFWAVMEILPTIEEDRESLRAELIDTLRERELESVRRQLFRMAETGRRPDLRREAAVIIGSIADPDESQAIDTLIAALESDRQDVRKAARESLIDLGSNRVRRRIRDQLIRHTSAHARAEIAQIIGQLGGDRLREELTSLTEDEDPAVRKHAYAAIEQLDRGENP